ncbi:MAG: SpoIVB peptidase [Lachnospiraceae bacterium]|nr:SpoIVB peptidase [Lachnospiraceae bacterium]
MEEWKLAVIQREKNRIRIYRRLLVAVTFILFSVMFTLTYMQAYNCVPKQIRLIQGDWQQWDFRLPVKGTITKLDGAEIQNQDSLDSLQVSGQRPSNIPADAISIDLSKEISVKADAMETYLMDLKLFGIIPFKQVEIQVMQEQMVVPAGIPIGIYVKTEGVLVVGTGDFEGLGGVECNPCEFVLKSGDYILEVDECEIDYKNQLVERVEESDGEKMDLTILRGEETLKVSVTPQKNLEGDYKLGIWVRDNAQGVGTLTFIDEEGNFGALGHGISDVDTGEVLNLKSGTLYSTQIIALKKGKSGEPGEMTGMIEYVDANIWGIIDENSDKGIYGDGNKKLLDQVESKALPIGLKHEIEKGAAQILCSVEGEPKYYDVEIKDVYLENAHVNRGILLEVTDPELLAVTGGIIQGMSGAPIIQDGKIIGAVTHVLVQDATSGYGIFIENMLEHN